MTLLCHYLVAMFIFLAIDALWLTQITGAYFVKHLGPLMADSPKLWAAACFYLMYGLVIALLITIPHKTAPLWQVFGYGALLGLASYGAFELTALAVIKGWPAGMVLLDILWGTVLTGTVAAGTVALANRFNF